MQVTTLGIDLAKQVFQVHGIDAHGAVVLKKTIHAIDVTPLYGQPSAVPSWDGSLWRRQLLEPSVPSVRP